MSTRDQISADTTLQLFLGEGTNHGEMIKQNGPDFMNKLFAALVKPE